MSLRKLKDQELLSQTKSLVQHERKLLTRILEHLREVEYRRLYCELKYDSLFAYCVGELRYSEGAAGRRIQAMKLIREIPAVEKKIEEGKLSLSNLCQVQSYFREAARLAPKKAITSAEKLNVISKLENRSARDGQRILMSMSPERAIPREKLRPITASVTEASFIIDSELEIQLKELRSLLGPEGATMSMSSLIKRMVSLSIEQARTKKFGKKRSQGKVGDGSVAQDCEAGFCSADRSTESKEFCVDRDNMEPTAAPTSELKSPSATAKDGKTKHSKPGSERHLTDMRQIKTSRYIPRSVKHEVWTRDQGRCCCCKSSVNLQFDHITPLSSGGPTSSENLRLLCFACNQRAGIRVFGVEKFDSYRNQPRELS